MFHEIRERREAHEAKSKKAANYNHADGNKQSMRHPRLKIFAVHTLKYTTSPKNISPSLLSTFREKPGSSRKIGLEKIQERVRYFVSARTVRMYTVFLEISACPFKPIASSRNSTKSLIGTQAVSPQIRAPR